MKLILFCFMFLEVLIVNVPFCTSRIKSRFCDILFMDFYFFLSLILVM